MNQDQCMAKTYADAYWDHTDPARLYDKFGFKEAARHGERVVMKKSLEAGVN